VPCQQYAHLPRRPRYALPPRPVTFNRIIALDTFQLRADLPKVLDITCLHTDFGLGRLTPSMRGDTMFVLLYLTWLAIWGSRDTVITDRGFEAENDAFFHALTSMGIHWRPAPTEALWTIGRNERHYGLTRDAFLRITAETPAFAPDLALAMAYKACNDAARAHGACPTTAVTGDPPRLLIGHNHHADPSIAARTRAMQTARNTMEAYTAAESLRGALSHPGTNVPFVQVGQNVWFHRHNHGWLRGTVHSLDGKTVSVRHNSKLFSCYEARTKPHVSRHPPARLLADDPSAMAPPAPIGTNAPAPPPAATLPHTSRTFLAHPPDPDSPNHPRWDAAKLTEINVFIFIDCKTTVPSRSVPPSTQIFNYLWRVTYNPNRGNGKPAERARYCVAGNQDWH